MDLKNFIIHNAKEIGFSEIGFAKAKIDDVEKENLKLWLEKNYQAKMEWIKNKFFERINPELLLEDVRSVIVLSTNYYTNYNHTSEIGKISRYAWGDDYHKIINDRLKNLIKIINEKDKFGKYKFYTDTGAVLEKYFAEKSGIAWRGKNSNAISRNFGSWFFLSVILTTTDFESDIVHENYCGSCNACIEACPTFAIVKPYVIDSNKCISYLTIEHRGEIENELSKNFSGWIFGCDICQDVCPWNKFAKPTKTENLSPKEKNTNLDLDKVLNLTQEEFNLQFKNSPIKRSKLEGLKRNAKILKKNLKD